MEHLLSPPNTEPILVPYLETEEYDGGDFVDYPARKGWSAKDLQGIAHFGGRSEHEVEEFFQTWLYFGCLISVFGIAGISVTTKDFIAKIEDGILVINTEKFEGLVQEWMNRESMNDPSYSYLAPTHDPKSIDKGAKKVRGDAIREILNRVLEFVDRYCNSAAQEKAYAYGSTPVFWPISPILSMCIMAIGSPLLSVAFEIYGHPRYQQPHWGSSPFLNERLLKAGWCPRDIPLFGENASVDCDYYFGGFDSPKQHMDHSECTKDICVAIHLDSSAYRTRHAKGCPEIDCPFVHSPENTIVEIIKAEHIPTISYYDNELHVVDQGDARNYVAISHVWSDGLGNNEVNALPRCQLLRLQSMVNQAVKEVHRDYTPENSVPRSPSDIDSSGSWETVEGSEPDRPSVEHCGFWIDTLCVPVNKKLETYRDDAIVMMAQIYSSAQRVLVLDAFTQEVSRTAPELDRFIHLYLSSWHRRLWTLQEALLAKRLSFQFSDGSQTMRDMHSIEDDRDPSPRMFYSHVRAGCGGEFDPFYAFLTVFASTDIVNRFHTFAHLIRFRATTKARDEPVCFATILGLEVKEMIKESKDHDVRMAHLYKLIKKFDSRILFNDFPRLPIPGFRWAPRSFLGNARRIFNPAEEGKAPHATLHDRGGLVVKYPGIKLESPPSTTPIRFAVREDPSTQYVIYLQVEETQKMPAWDANSSYYVISADQFEQGRAGQTLEAVIGVLLGQDRRGRIKIGHVARARVEHLVGGQKQAGADEANLSASDTNPSTPCTFGRWLGPKQKWIVY